MEIVLHVVAILAVGLAVADAAGRLAEAAVTLWIYGRNERH